MPIPSDTQEAAEIPIFPLNTVLFPGGMLPLRVFEARYMDMARECLKTKAPFGVCRIVEGREVGDPATPANIGCAAHIAECDMQQLGVLNLVTRGTRRFRIVELSVGAQGLVKARVQWLAAELDASIPDEYSGCVALLKAIAGEERFRHLAKDAHFESASWVGYRLSEVLPIPLRIKQQLLEIEGAVPRLLVLYQFLEQRGLLGRN
ncbi:MAG: LON peptidase substrate-binding domain-containing protein [Burkholderiales bacterium]